MDQNIHFVTYTKPSQSVLWNLALTQDCLSCLKEQILIATLSRLYKTVEVNEIDYHCSFK